MSFLKIKKYSWKPRGQQKSLQSFPVRIKKWGKIANWKSGLNRVQLAANAKSLREIKFRKPKRAKYSNAESRNVHAWNGVHGNEYGHKYEPDVECKRSYRSRMVQHDGVLAYGSIFLSLPGVLLSRMPYARFLIFIFFFKDLLKI